MSAWWEALSILERVMLFFAVPATLILILQTVMLIIGFGDTDADSDFDADGEIDIDDIAESDAGFRIFTVRGFVAFFTIFGWCGFAMLRSGVAVGISVFVSTIAGFLAMLLVAFMLMSILKLQASGNLNAANAVGKTAMVYITIPKNREGRGKVNLIVQERFAELDAVTDFSEDIKTGAEVTVIGTNSRNELIVRPRSK